MVWWAILSNLDYCKSSLTRFPASPLTTHSTDHSHHSQCEPLNTEVRSHNSSTQSPAGAPSQSQPKVLQTAQQSTTWSACSHCRHRPKPISFHSPSRSLLSATLASLPVLEHARHDFSFACSQISFYLIPFLPSSFCQEVTSSLRLPWPPYLKLQPTLSLQIWLSLSFVCYLHSSRHSLTCVFTSLCLWFLSPWS